MQGWIQDFLREGASQAEMTDVQSQRSAENMHASANWVSWQCTTGLLTALIEYLTVQLVQSRWQGTTGIWYGPGLAWLTLSYTTTHPPRSATKFVFIC